MALYRSSHSIRRAVANSWRLSLKPISAAYNSCDWSYFNENNDNNWCRFNFVKRPFTSGSPHMKFSNTDTSTSSYSTLHPLHEGPSYMRAAVFWEPNKPLTIEDFQMPRPKANEILIKTKGTSVPPIPLFLLLYISCQHHENRKSKNLVSFRRSPN